MSRAPNVQRLDVERMTRDAFAPFGTLLTADPSQDPDYADADSLGWRHHVDMVGCPELVIARTHFVGGRFSRLERHIGVTQAFFPLSDVPAAVAVARSSPDSSLPPRPVDVRAFAVERGVGYLLHPDTWHSLDRYPLRPGFIDVIMLTSEEMTAEALGVNQSEWRLTQEADYLEIADMEFELTLAGFEASDD